MIRGGFHSKSPRRLDLPRGEPKGDSRCATLGPPNRLDARSHRTAHLKVVSLEQRLELASSPRLGTVEGVTYWDAWHGVELDLPRGMRESTI